MTRVYAIPEDELARLRAENARLKAERERMAADALRLEAQAAAYRAALERIAASPFENSSTLIAREALAKGGRR